MSRLDDFFEVLERSASSRDRKDRALGTVDPAYVAGTQKAKVTFDGETSLSRAYPRTVTVSAGNRVTLLNFGGTWVITGVIQ